MIGSHNTMTYLKPKFLIFRPFSFLWRCQDKDLDEQKKLGVKYLDIRVRYSKRDELWYFCHGLVDLKEFHMNMELLINSLEFTGCKYRLILERGDDKCKSKFFEEVTKYKGKNMVYAGYKKPWTTIFGELIHGFDYSYVPFYTGKRPENAPKFTLTTIKRYAKKHNPIITKKLIEDDIAYTMDYVGINN